MTFATNESHNLAAKIAAVAAEMKKVPKNGTNKNDGYKYAMAADVFDAVREALATQKVAIIPRVDSSVSTIADRAKGVLATLWIDYQFVDGESGDTLTARIVSTAADYGMADKAVFKAETNALKYLLFQVFQISTGDDDVEHDASEPKDDKPSRKSTPVGKKTTSTTEKTAPTTEKTAPAAKGAMSADEKADILFLNEQLGAKKRSNAQLNETVKAHGAKALIEILVGDHLKEHGKECPHYTDGSDGAIVVKRG